MVGGDLYRHVDLWSGGVLPDDGSCRVNTTRFVVSGTLVGITTQSTFTIVCRPLILQLRSQCRFMRFILSVLPLVLHSSALTFWAFSWCKWLTKYVNRCFFRLQYRLMLQISSLSFSQSPRDTRYGLLRSLRSHDERIKRKLKTIYVKAAAVEFVVVIICRSVEPFFPRRTSSRGN